MYIFTIHLYHLDIQAVCDVAALKLNVCLFLCKKYTYTQGITEDITARNVDPPVQEIYYFSFISLYMPKGI